MTIATRLKINALVSIGMILLISLLFGLAFQMQNKAHDRAMVAQDLMKGAFELNILSDRYLRYPEQRPREQWLILHDSLARAVRSISGFSGVPKILDQRMAENLNDMKVLFDRLVGMHQAFPVINETKGVQDHVLSAQLNQLSHLMFKRSREISLDATRVAATANARIDAIQRQLLVGTPVVGAVLAILAWSWARRIGRSIIIPLRDLQSGSEIIGTGNLDYRVGMTAADEIGELSRAFDQMAKRLKETTISRDELERQVAERTAQLQTVVEELRRSNEDLEKFAYISSHDLQEPLRMVRMYVGLLAEHCKDVCRIAGGTLQGCSRR
jgi:signal transduction histidine kinase